LRWLVWFSILAAMRRALPLFALFALLACDRNPHAGPQPVANDPAFAGQKTTEPAPARAAVDPAAGACAQASLALPADAVIATIDGTPLTFADLGEGAARAEADALRTYCQAVATARQDALNNAIDKQLIERAAKAAGSPSIEAYMQAKVEAAGGEPSEEELLAFYNKHASPEAPPFEAVRQQVVEAMVEERTRGTIDALVAEARKGATISQNLPDVRPPPLDLSITDDQPSKGDPAGVISVVEFSDFECPYCSRAADTLTGLVGRYPQKVRFAFRHFPLSFHPNARPAAEHSVCAQEQGKFWEFHDLVFRNQRGLSGEKLGELAAEAGMDSAKLSECLGSGRARAKVDADYAKGLEVGVQGTPSFYINGQAYAGNPTVEAIGAAIDAELARAGS
jgi:protein-disulfide isomerase